MEPTQVWAIFGENLLAKESLVEVFIALVGGVTSHYRNHVNGQKVFECVGTFREGIAAVHLATIQVGGWTGLFLSICLCLSRVLMTKFILRWPH